MDKLYAPENLGRLSDCIVAALKSQDDDRLETLLSVLKVIISGPPGERCQAFYGSRIPADRCLAMVLSSPEVQSTLVADPAKCGKIIDILRGLPYLTSHHCRALGFLLRCTPSSSELRKDLVRTILTHDDLHKFEVETISAALREDTTPLEMSLIALCTEDSPDQALLQYQHWVSWCACSSNIFQIVTSLLLELLKHLKCRTKVLKCTLSFVAQVQKKCDRSEMDFVSLYPTELQALVGLMIMTPSVASDEVSMCVRTQVLFEHGKLQLKDPSSALLLLTHFPQWAEWTQQLYEDTLMN